MRISSLYDKIDSEEIYLIGTGASMNLFPLEYLKNKFCVLLNNTGLFVRVLGPVVFSNNLSFIDRKSENIKHFAVKVHNKNDANPEIEDNHLSWDDPFIYGYSYKREFSDLSDIFGKDIDPDFYWNIQEGTVATMAVQFAIMSGAKSIILVGCDCGDLNGDHYFYGKEYAANWNDKYIKPIHLMQTAYEGYARSLRKIQRYAKEQYGVVVLSLTPFCGIGHEVEQYKEFINR